MVVVTLELVVDVVLVTERLVVVIVLVMVVAIVSVMDGCSCGDVCVGIGGVCDGSESSKGRGKSGTF